MTTERLIQIAVVRADMALCEIGRALMAILPTAAAAIGLYIAAHAAWRAFHGCGGRR